MTRLKWRIVDEMCRRAEADHVEADTSVATADRVLDAAADSPAAEARQTSQAEGAD